MGEILELLAKAVLDYDKESARDLARRTIEENIDPVKAADAMAEAIRKVGKAFESGTCWLPDLVGAANAMQAAIPIIAEEIAKRGAKKKSLGTVVIGTVFGDIHSIGKNMVATLLRAEGFEVKDLGVNVKAEAFVDAIKEFDAEILAMSALLTMTAPEQRRVIQALKRETMRDRVKIMVGGGPIDAEFAETIGADGYDPTAPGAVGLAKRLVGR